MKGHWLFYLLNSAKFWSYLISGFFAIIFMRKPPLRMTYIPGLSTHWWLKDPPKVPSHPLPIVPFLQHHPSLPHQSHLPPAHGYWVWQTFQQSLPPFSSSGISVVGVVVVVVWARLNFWALVYKLIHYNPLMMPQQKAPGKHPGSTQEAPGKHPGSTREAPRKHPGSTHWCTLSLSCLSFSSVLNDKMGASCVLSSTKAIGSHLCFPISSI